MIPARLILSVTLPFALVGSPVFAAADEADTPERFSVLLTYGDDECPEPVGDEIVVCANQPESERYRIPKDLRRTEEDRAAEQSWTSRVETQDEIARSSRPGSCSVIGTNGFSGCQSAALRRWFEERREAGN